MRGDTVFDWLPHLPGVLDFVIAVGGFLVALGLIGKFVVRPMFAQGRKFNQAADTMLGYPEVKDPGTGRVIQVATPPLAHRVYELESAAIKMADAMMSIAETQREILELTTRIGDLQVAFEEHEQTAHAWVQQHDEQFQTWIREHEALHTIVAEARSAPAAEEK